MFCIFENYYYCNSKFEALYIVYGKQYYKETISFLKYFEENVILEYLWLCLVKSLMQEAQYVNKV